ncbi:MAG TPA: membrane protein insertase YidC [Polyangiaceae bacterium]|jgi:YidC/Oxa1 family membrane protein insertase|nr:membrane protein insertase YidC [Polyangiaceae bacterium]
MDRNTIVRWILIAGAMAAMYYFFFDKKSNGTGQELLNETYVDAPGFAPDVIDVQPGRPAPTPPPPAPTCTIEGKRFRAELSAHGAGLTHFYLTDARYRKTAADDMSTTPDVERWRNLRTEFRAQPGMPAATDDQVKYDRFDWNVESLGGSGCRFDYQDDAVHIVKTVSAGLRPFELDVETTLTNLADSPKKHTATVEAFAYRTNGEVQSHLGRVSPFLTNLECARGTDVKRKSKDDDAFKKPPFWFEEPLDDRYAAIANYYFAQALVPLDLTGANAPEKPSCQLLAEKWYGSGQKPDDEQAGAIYHARLAYPSRVLAPHDSATYKQIAFFGPKERDVLANAAGGAPRLGDLINLGTFSPVAKVLVTIISWIHAHITMGNWGLAIIVLTLGLRTAVFPLTWKQIQSTIAMRKLKPEIDALNEKFKDDAQSKNIAMMELWKKHKVNPLGGCLPALVQMPIWFALYATLQTAVEFYHTPFLWFADLSAPDRFFLLPIVLGGAMIVQQRIVPQQGMDPMQAKMMTWLMPGVFTVMMLFLPAALGVYMLTNSVLGITQQLVIEKVFPRAGGISTAEDDGVGRDKKQDKSLDGPNKRNQDATSAAALRKGKARV